MDAVLSETKSTASPSRFATPMANWVALATSAILITGLLWRVVRYLAGFPIWGDEAMLLLSVLDRDYAGLTQLLDYNQVAPLGFLWLEKSALLMFGSSEWSLHLFPALAGVGALILFRRMARVAMPAMVAGLAVSILAVSYYPVRHACEVKPYAFDLFYAVLLTWLTLEVLHSSSPGRWLGGLALATPFAVFSSYPSVFVGGAVSLVLLPRMRSATWTQRGLFVAYNAALLGSFLIHYGMTGQHDVDPAEAERTRVFLRSYWNNAFPPDSIVHWPFWLLQVFTGNMLAYPAGGAHGGSSLSFALVLVGSIAMWRSGRRALLALCWLPFGLSLVAAILDKYPFGSSARITQHLAPFICILMAFGIADLLDRIRTPGRRMHVHLTIATLLWTCGVFGIVRDLRQPYKTQHDHDIRQLARDIACQAGVEPVLVCHPRDRRMLAELVWYMRIEIPTLHWLPDSPLSDPQVSSCWLVLCNHHEPTLAELQPHLPGAGWRIIESDVRLVPPENAKMAPVYCRKARVARE